MSEKFKNSLIMKWRMGLLATPTTSLDATPVWRPGLFSGLWGGHFSQAATHPLIHKLALFEKMPQPGGNQPAHHQSNQPKLS